MQQGSWVGWSFKALSGILLGANSCGILGKRKTALCCWPGGHLGHRAEHHRRSHNWSLALTVYCRSTSCSEPWCQGSKLFPGALPYSSLHFLPSLYASKASTLYCLQPVGCKPWGPCAPDIWVLLHFQILFSIPHHCSLPPLCDRTNLVNYSSWWCYQLTVAHKGQERQNALLKYPTKCLPLHLPPSQLILILGVWQ